MQSLSITAMDRWKGVQCVLSTIRSCHSHCPTSNVCLRVLTGRAWGMLTSYMRCKRSSASFSTTSWTRASFAKSNWEKFKATLLFRQWPAGANLLIMAAGEFFTMLCFGIWLHWITFPGVSFRSLLLYVYTSLQLTKATAEAIIRHIDGELSLQAGPKIAITCHSIVILAIIFVIPLVSFLLEKVGLLFQL